MRRYSDRDVIQEAKAFLDSNKSIIKTAETLDMPQSTLHWHLQKRLKDLDCTLWHQVNFIMIGRRTR